MALLIKKYKSLIVLICLCVISLILSWSYVPRYEDGIYSVGMDNNSVKSGLSLFIVPNQIIEHTISFFAEKIIGAGEFFGNLFHKPIEEREFEALQHTLQSLNLQIEEERQRSKGLEKLWQLNNNLSESKPTYRFMPARVISIEPMDWFRYITINKGRNQGINVDMAVITYAMSDRPNSENTTGVTSGAVVGKVSSIQSNTAKVQLITDRLSVVAVTIGPQRDLALLKGRPEYEDCTIEEVPSTTHDMLSQGDAVIVDDRSSIFPPGMMVGWITSIDKRLQFCHIEVRPAFKFSRLSDVLVITNSGY